MSNDTEKVGDKMGIKLCFCRFCGYIVEKTDAVL